MIRIVTAIALLLILASLTTGLTLEELVIDYWEKCDDQFQDSTWVEMADREFSEFSAFFPQDSVIEAITWEMACPILDSLGITPSTLEAVKPSWDEDESFRGPLQRDLFRYQAYETSLLPDSTASQQVSEMIVKWLGIEAALARGRTSHKHFMEVASPDTFRKVFDELDSDLELLMDDE